jgi:regulator of RNase E activity RraB
MPEWISYDQDPAGAISFDAELLDEAEFRTANPIAVTIKVSGFEADSNGQPTDAASDALFAYEQALESALAENESDLVATVTEPNTFMLLAYAASNNAATVARGVKCPYPADVQSDTDTSWSKYEELALRGEELEEARDDEQIAQLEEEGFEQGDEITVFFALSFPDEEKLAGASRALELAGFEAPQVEEFNELQAAKRVALAPDEIKAARTQLMSIVKPFGATYDGWGIDEDEEDEVPV